ncbi:hypothetical protein Hypma_008907 [Hypsizygus marmoreus]|uniref:F-box domain-containing protein n=1 Tax=Hypsizygus marmoreus TaxID=39966 RepID=A0A369JXW8_HYPMA|nr:hypothetical protein Hypma_008907 [Hypsizygus marmoreus]
MMHSMPQHDPGYSNLADLPVELLVLIFYPLRPTFPRTSDDPANSDIIQYRRDVKAFARLRRLTIAVSQVITPPLFEEVIIWANQTTGIRDLFALGADHIKNLVIYGPSALSYHRKQSPRLPDNFEDAIGQGLGRCSQIRSLECYELHTIFARRNWLARYALSLPSTLRRLVLHAYKMNVSYALLGLGRSLETLEIRDWDSTVSPTMTRPTHLPSKMPNLKHIALHSRVPRINDLKKLFRRITSGRRPSNYLESISFIEVRNLGAHVIIEILSINDLGTHLTSFRLKMSSHWQLHIRSAMDILKACPNLLEFAYPPAAEETLQHLPRLLQELEVMLVPEYWDYDPPMIYLIPLLTHVKSGQTSHLRILSIVSASGYVINRASLVSAFAQVGLHFAACVRLPKGGWRIRL